MCATRILFCLSFVLACGGGVAEPKRRRAWNPGLRPMEVVRKYGYSGETHKVQTEDGYILTLHRLSRSPLNVSRPVFFLQHGLACSSSMWLAPPKAMSLPFLLADRGYDVWLGNSRGNRYSTEHVRYNASDMPFWDFSWHEMGVYDMPAVLDYILLNTGKRELTFVGHSMGVAMMTLFLATRPEYNQKLTLAFGFAPAVHVQSMRSVPLRFLCTFYASYLLKTGPQNWLPNVDNFTDTHWKYCETHYPTYLVCHVAYRLLAGPSDVTKKSMSSVLTTLPTTTSAKTFAHFGQTLRSGKFRPYSYGEKYNYLRYGTKEPPEYNIKNVTVPFALFYSEDDYAVHPKNVIRLAKELPNTISLYKVPALGFNHLDFVFGTHVHYLFKELTRILDAYENDQGSQFANQQH